MKPTIVGISLIVGMSMAAASALPMIAGLPTIASPLSRAIVAPMSRTFATAAFGHPEPLFTDEEPDPRFPETVIAELNLAAMDAPVISLDGEYFVATVKECRPGWCEWHGRSLAFGRGSMTLTVANDGLEGNGFVQYANGSYATFSMEVGKARLSRGPELSSPYWCATGLLESYDRMGARALERMARASGLVIPGR